MRIQTSPTDAFSSRQQSKLQSSGGGSLATGRTGCEKPFVVVPSLKSGWPTLPGWKHGNHCPGANVQVAPDEARTPKHSSKQETHSKRRKRTIVFRLCRT